MGNKINFTNFYPKAEIKVFDQGKAGVLEPNDKVKFSYLDKNGRIITSCKTQAVDKFLKEGDCLQGYFRPASPCAWDAYKYYLPLALDVLAKRVNHLQKVDESTFKVTWMGEKSSGPYVVPEIYKVNLNVYFNGGGPGLLLGMRDSGFLFMCVKDKNYQFQENLAKSTPDTPYLPTPYQIPEDVKFQIYLAERLTQKLGFKSIDSLTHEEFLDYIEEWAVDILLTQNSRYPHDEYGP